MSTEQFKIIKKPEKKNQIVNLLNKMIILYNKVFAGFQYTRRISKTLH